MSDRLAELQRQRALAQEQLAWLDREIARETGQAPAVTPLVTPAAPPAKVTIAPAAPLAPVSDAATAHVADEIIAQYQQDPHTTAKDVKKGCYVWFFLALGLVVLGATAIILVYSRK